MNKPGYALCTYPVVSASDSSAAARSLFGVIKQSEQAALPSYFFLSSWLIILA